MPEALVHLDTHPGVPSSRSSIAAVVVALREGYMPPLHVHDEDEAFHVLEGAVTLHVGDERVALAAGDTFYAPAGVPHTYRAETRTELLATTYVAAAGRYEDFLGAVARPNGPLLPQDEATLAALAAPNGIVVLGAPGALPV